MPGVCCPATKDNVKPTTPTPLRPVTQSYRPSTTTKRLPPKVISTTEVVLLETQTSAPLGQLPVDPEGNLAVPRGASDRRYLSRSAVIYIIWHGDLESIATTHITGKSVQNIVIKNYDLEAKRHLPLALTNKSKSCLSCSIFTAKNNAVYGPEGNFTQRDANTN